MSVSEAKQTLQFEGGVLLGRQEAALARGALLFLRDGQVVKRMLITITLKPVFPLPTWLLAWTVSFRPADRRFFLPNIRRLAASRIPSTPMKCSARLPEFLRLESVV
jgi:hypothetical protein